MQYRNGYSLLGFGCMRLPKDYGQSKALVLHAIDAGINYFDTAYMYQGNEALLGRILAESDLRGDVMIATKLPPFSVNKPEDFEKRFQTQLERLQTQYIDNYLMHMLSDAAMWDRLKSIGVVEWLSEKKAAGQIKRIGFSFHGKTEAFLELLDVYPWDFCQVQYNYMDESTQAGRKGVEAAAAKGIEVIIMEPLQGGNLTVGLPPKAQDFFSTTGITPATWGLRWLYAQSEISCVLSGMNTMEMLEENIAISSNETPFTDEDEAVIEQARTLIREGNKIGCTGCAYCMPCPSGVDIPGSFSSYNTSYNKGYFKGFSNYLMYTTLKVNLSNAGRCTECGLCETKCPQGLSIREDLQKVKKRLETPIYKVVTAVSRSAFKEK